MCSSNRLIGYLTERYPVKVYLPLSIFLGVGLLYVEPDRAGWPALARLVLLVCLLLFPFRLLDDLYSVAEDRERAPHRWLCRAEDLRTFWLTLYAVVAANTALLFAAFGPLRWNWYVLLFGGLHCWYAIAGRIPALKKQFYLPLLKYPLLAFVLTDVPWFSGRLWIFQVLVLGVFIIYEVSHDPKYEIVFPALKGSIFKRYGAARFVPFIGVMGWFVFAILWGI